MRTTVWNCILLLLVFCKASPCFALNSDLNKLDSELVKVMGSSDPSLRESVRQYRKEVEASAYKTTLRLCWAYRAASGLDNSHPINDTIKYEKGTVADTITKKTPSGKVYTYSMADSLSAWDELFSKGLEQATLSWYGLGKQSQYSRFAGYGFFDIQAWSQSAHTVFFLNSFEFLRGAVHCLNSTNHIDIERFAGWIVLADSFGMGGGQVIGAYTSFAVGGFVISGLFKGLRATLGWTLRPLSVALKNAKRLLTKPRLIVFGVPTAVLLTDNLMCQLSKKDQMKKMADEIGRELLLEGDLVENSLTYRYSSILTLYKKFLAFHGACEKKLAVDSLTKDQLNACEDEKALFVSQYRSSPVHKNLRFYLRDQQDLSVNLGNRQIYNTGNRHPHYCTVSGEVSAPRDERGLVDNEQIYHDLLAFLMPILKTL